MGIQRFLRRMQDAGFGSSLTDLAQLGGESQIAILDGPNLAFNVAGRLLEKARAVDGTIWPSITYAEFITGVIDFLDMLHSYGFEISAIFFDGALPATKKDIRIARLQRYVDSLVAYQALHQEFSKTSRMGMTDASKAWNSPTLERSRGALPGLPFLVPAIVEGLSKSVYADVTYVVPGEADGFCVAAARKACAADSSKKVVIFSNDSDLLVYNCGPQTRVVMFTELGTGEGSSPTASLSGMEFSPAAMAKKAGKEDLIEVAYQMEKDNIITLNWVLQLLQQGDCDITSIGFQDFKQTYQIDQEQADLELLQNDIEAHLNLVNLDARVSELTHQAKAGLTHPSSDGLDMFLPFLLEDPTKKTGWYIGRRSRLAAYEMILAACGCAATTVQEYKRSAGKISVQRLTSADMSRDTTELWLAQLSTRIGSAWSRCRSDMNETQKWRFAVMQITLLDMVDEEMLLPLPEEIGAILQCQNAKDWDLFHLSAQYQAAYYSLRMLVQIWRYIKNKGVPLSRSWLKREADMRAHMHVLDKLPSISDFFDTDAGKGPAPTPLVEALLKSLEAEGHARFKARPDVNKERKRKQKNEGKERVGMMRKRTASTNPFAALDCIQ